MEYKPLFSVLIANYNNGKYLMDAIESVRKQTYTNWEIILVDDASTDISHELYTQLEQDERIHIYYNEQNQGCGYTKHRCAKLANGELCGFLDPDDAITENALELEAKIHIEHPEVAIVYSKVLYCDADFNVFEEGFLPNLTKGQTYFDYRCHGAMNFASYKNALYKLTDGINPNLRAAVDQDLYFRIEETGDIYLLNEFTYKYVTKGHENSIATDFRKYASTWYWNLIARRDTCIRRNLPEEMLIPDFQSILDNYAKEIIDKKHQEIIEELAMKYAMEFVWKREKEIRSSYAYRLGCYILKPFKLLQKCLKKN
jgi:glycosyltransferase involved in cell wall biosynthesis